MQMFYRSPDNESAPFCGEIQCTFW